MSRKKMGVEDRNVFERNGTQAVKTSRTTLRMEELTVSCRDPEAHNQKWLVQRPSILRGPPLCLACAVLTLEDRCQLSVRKRFVLTAVLDALHNVAEHVVKVIGEEDQVAFRVIAVVLDLTNATDHNLVSSAAECLLLFLCHLKNERLGLAVMERLSTRLQAECNYQQSVLDFQLLGRLLQMFPGLAQSLLHDNVQLLHFLATGLSYPCDKVKSSIIYIFVCFYGSTTIITDDTFTAVHAQIAKGLLPVLKNSQVKDVLINALALLKRLVSKESIVLSFIMQTQSENVTFATALKKILLSNDPILQISSAQCICHIMSGHSEAEAYTNILLDANIPEFLFEVLSTSNELLIESILCCISIFTDHPSFFTKCHAVYGIESILRATEQLLEMKNWRVAIVGLDLLTVMFSKYQSSVCAMPQDTVFKQAVHLLEKILTFTNQPLILAASTFFCSFLRKENLPRPLPISCILSLFETCMVTISKLLIGKEGFNVVAYRKQKKVDHISKQSSQMKGNISLEVKLLEAGLHIVCGCSRLVKDYFTDPLNRENTFSCPVTQTCNEKTLPMEENQQSKDFQCLDELMKSTLASLDDIFIPYALLLGPSDPSGEVACGSLLCTLAEIYEEYRWKEADYLLPLTHKLVKTGFINYFWSIRTSPCSTFHRVQAIKTSSMCFLKRILSILLKDHNINESYLDFICIGSEQLDGSLESCASILSQKCDFSNESQQFINVAAAQFTFLFLCYTSYLHGVLIIPLHVLLPHLVCFTTLNADQLHFPIITLKHLTFLLSICTYELQRKEIYQETPGLDEANTIIKDILKMSSPSAVYTHHKALLWWCFISNDHNVFYCYVLEEWLKYCTDTGNQMKDKEEASNSLLQLICENKCAQLSFMACFENTFDIANRASHFLKLAWELQVDSTNNSLIGKGFQELMRLHVEHLPSISIQLFLTTCNNEDKSKEKLLSLLLEMLLWCQQHLCQLVKHSDLELKLLFHVVTYSSSSTCQDQYTLISCMDYLQTVLSEDLNTDDRRGFCIIVGNDCLISLLQNCLKQQNRKDLLTSALKLIVVILNFQVHHDIHCVPKIKITVADIFKWLRIGIDQEKLTYKLLYWVLKSEFQNTILQISTKKQISLFFGKCADDLHFTKTDIRLLIICLQNALVKGNPHLDEEAVSCLLVLIEYVAKKDSSLEKHLMLQPWIRIILEARLLNLKVFDEGTLKLLEKWLCFCDANPAILGLIYNFAKEVLVSEDSLPLMFKASILSKLCTGAYSKHINSQKARKSCGRKSL